MTVARMMVILIAMSAAVIATSVGCAREAADSPPTRGSDLGQARRPALTPQKSGTSNRLQAVSPVDARIVWASGLGGTYATTLDGGATWRARVVPGAEALEFRDVHAVSDRVAYLLAAGDGTRSRIYKTRDGGETWSLQFQNQDPHRFYDCFAFWSPTRGVAMADSTNGRFPVIGTADGQTWKEIGDHLPAAQPEEAAFAASGTCVATHGATHAWIATGSAARARVLATTDGGGTWTAVDVPIGRGAEGSGGFSVAFRDRRHGILGGGDLAAPTMLANNVARSRDGGRTWEIGSVAPFPGAIYGLGYALGPGPQLPGDAARARVVVVATGPGGASWSPDEGDTWFHLAGVTHYWAVAFATRRTGWLVGTEGRILKIEL